MKENKSRSEKQIDETKHDEKNITTNCPMPKKINSCASANPDIFPKKRGGGGIEEKKRRKIQLFLFFLFHVLFYYDFSYFLKFKDRMELLPRNPRGSANEIH